MNIVIDSILAHLPQHKSIPSGWTTFNAVCCHHRGHRPDRNHRGGIIVKSDVAITYHCFNCRFKTTWVVGHTLSNGMKSFMSWLGISDSLIAKLSLEAIKFLNHDSLVEYQNLIPSFTQRRLPDQSQLLTDVVNTGLDDNVIKILEYLDSRNLYLSDYKFYYSKLQPTRLIIPFYYHNQLVGYTSRSIEEKPKYRYFSDQQPNYVFNLDHQTYDREFVILCEGPLDAISIDGCATLGSEITEGQNWLIKQLRRKVIYVPDCDKMGRQAIDQAIEYGYSVSMPEWPETNTKIKDINDAVKHFGRLATLWMIVQNSESNNLKIKLKAKKYFN